MVRVLPHQICGLDVSKVSRGRHEVVDSSGLEECLLRGQLESVGGDVLAVEHQKEVASGVFVKGFMITVNKWLWGVFPARRCAITAWSLSYCHAYRACVRVRTLCKMQLVR